MVEFRRMPLWGLWQRSRMVFRLFRQWGGRGGRLSGGPTSHRRAGSPRCGPDFLAPTSELRAGVRPGARLRAPSSPRPRLALALDCAGLVGRLEELPPPLLPEKRL